MLLGKIKLYDIAKEFDMSSKDILAIAVKLNIDAKSHLSSVSDEDAERIRKEAKNTNKTKPNNVKKDSKKVADNKGATPVIIRREVIVEDTTKKSIIKMHSKFYSNWKSFFNKNQQFYFDGSMSDKAMYYINVNKKFTKFRNGRPQIIS